MNNKQLIIISVSALLLVNNATAAEQSSEKKLKAIYQKAEKAIEENKIPEADFWLARYMGLTAFNEATERNCADLYPLFDKRKDLVPTAFISGKYADDFTDFFIRVMRKFWGIEEEGINEDTLEFQVRGDSEKDYFAEIVVSPRLECWYILKKKDLAVVIPLISSEKAPFIVSGRLKDGEPVKYFAEHNIDTEGHFLHYIWPIEFHDLDGDGVPEIWIRYNVAWADGFSQRLDIYRIKDDKELILLKRFEGFCEGIARRLKNGLIEVGEGFTNKEATGHLGYDQHNIQTFEYKNGDFVKISERNVPHILWSEEWTKYYFEQE
ncbi:MAG: hypothetical protein FJZ16_00580 [Candidatus Omnitrophica bacterium]|nr:hypothetical protein [Candidatus Omnitrophota bacterium]